MADTDDTELNDLADLAPEELSDELARDIAKRWDPERLLKLVAARAGKGEALDASLRARYEAKLGVDLSHVRVYTGAFAEEFNKQRNAEAVTIGGTGMILMGGTTDRPMESASGQALLAHELTHVAQAERGVHRKGAGVDMELATEEHEEEAEQAEAAEMQHQRGAAKDDGGARAKKEAADVNQQVMDKVLAMLGETMRVLIQRSGSPHRRP